MSDLLDQFKTVHTDTPRLVIFFCLGKKFHELAEKYLDFSNAIKEKKKIILAGAQMMRKYIATSKSLRQQREIASELGFGLIKVYNIAIRVYFTFSDFSNPQEKIFNCVYPPHYNWFGKLTKDKFLRFCDLLHDRQQNIKKK